MSIVLLPTYDSQKPRYLVLSIGWTSCLKRGGVPRYSTLSKTYFEFLISSSFFQAKFVVSGTLTRDGAGCNIS